MQLCCEAGDLEKAVRLINDPHTDVDVRISIGEAGACFPRIVHWACENGHVDVLEALLARRVDCQKTVRQTFLFCWSLTLIERMGLE